MTRIINNLRTRYHPHYVRALIYMLQANEYYPFEYLAWYHRTSDFSNIEKRKHLVYTAKAILLTAFAWFSLLFSATTSAIVALDTGAPGYIAAILGLALAPFIVPYTLFFLILAINTLQKPLEAAIIADARRKLKKHRAIKIAIAGSFGKTTMREILKTVLSEGKRVASPGGSHNTPLAIAKFIRGLSGNEEVLVFEFGEYYPGDIHKLCAFIEPDWGIITGVNEAHLERFGTLERAHNTIFELAQYLKDRLVYVNAESTTNPGRPADHYILYRREGAGEWKIESATTSIDGTIIF